MPRDQARIQEQKNSIGTAFMSLPPSQPLRTFIPPEQYRLGLRWWLGMPLIPEEEPLLSCPGCGEDADSLGDHIICCRQNSFQKRHDAVVEALQSALISAGQGVAREIRVPNTDDQ